VVRTKHYTFEQFAAAEGDVTPSGEAASHLMYMFKRAAARARPLILELGTGRGEATTVFLQACEERDGTLVSVDIRDCSDVSDSRCWLFVRCDSTDVQSILSRAPQLARGIDLLYIDSRHERGHVEREVTAWYPYMNQPSWLFFHDVDAQPYRRGGRKDSQRDEVALDGIHEYVRSFFYANEDSTRLSILYGSTGLACLEKLSPRGAVPRPAQRIVRRRKGA
jgi:predicted O-methyltransferase YrrM